VVRLCSHKRMYHSTECGYAPEPSLCCTQGEIVDYTTKEMLQCHLTDMLFSMRLLAAFSPPSIRASTGDNGKLKVVCSCRGYLVDCRSLRDQCPPAKGGFCHNTRHGLEISLFGRHEPRVKSSQANAGSVPGRDGLVGRRMPA